MDKGLVYVLTGDGKGKTTAAFGLALRAAGHKLRTLVIQFIKGPWQSGEVAFIKRKIPEIDVYTIGKGFVGIIGDKITQKVHQQKAEEAFSFMAQKIKTKKYQILILDEINIAINLNLIDKKTLLDFIKNKPLYLTLVLTGRNADKSIIKMADMVSEIKKIKHPYDKGKLAKKGIDF